VAGRPWLREGAAGSRVRGNRARLARVIRGLSTEDLDAMLSILEKYSPVVAGSARTPVTPRGHETDFRGSMERLPRLRPHFVEGRSARG
jgi:hypothetical protein